MRDSAGLCLVNSSREMTLTHVRDLMGHNRGELGFGSGVEEQARVDANDAAGGCKGVKLLAVDDDEREAMILQLTAGGEPKGDLL